MIIHSHVIIKAVCFVFCPDAADCHAAEGMGEWPVELERSCDTLGMCLVTTIKEGVRAGGGISDVLRKPASVVSWLGVYGVRT